jgi:hypothetical protein
VRSRFFSFCRTAGEGWIGSSAFFHWLAQTSIRLFRT